MDKERNNGGLIIGILIGIIIMLVVVIVLFATNTISFSGDNTVNNNDAVKEENVEQEDNVEIKENLDNEHYASIIEEYKSAMSDESFSSGSNKYPNVSGTMMNYYHTYKNISFMYAFNDINNDGKNEMIIGNGTDAIFEMYTYDGTKACRFFDSNCLGDRCGASIYDNGVIYFNGSGGASVQGYTFYKIGSDGYSKDTIKSYTAEYGESGNVTITDDLTKTVTNFKKVEDIISSVVGNANKVNLSKLSWTEIK